MFGADPDDYSVDVDSGAETEEEEGGTIAAKIEQRKKEEWNGDGEWKGKHNDICLTCDFGGSLICCYSCNLVFHLGCDPSLSRYQDAKSVPTGWRCTQCMDAESPSGLKVAEVKVKQVNGLKVKEVKVQQVNGLKVKEVKVKQVNELTVKELKTQLSGRGLSTKGRKKRISRKVAQCWCWCWCWCWCCC